MDDTGPYTKAGLTYKAGLTHDPENEELKDGERRALDEVNKVVMSDEINFERIARMVADPELVDIMSDPVILRLLTECSSNPAAAAAYLKNAGVPAAKVQKLEESGMLWIY